MAKTYRKTAPKRGERKYRDHGGLPQLVVKLCGCSLTMAYKVIDGHAVSAKVQAVVEEARHQLQREKGRVA